MGQVYRATDTKLHRRVAVKVLRPDDGAGPTSSPEAGSRLLREARAAAALDGPAPAARRRARSGPRGGTPAPRRVLRRNLDAEPGPGELQQGDRAPGDARRARR